MRSLLLSVSPQECRDILRGDQTILIRKKAPKGFVGWIYLYCKNDKKVKLCRCARPIEGLGHYNYFCWTQGYDRWMKTHPTKPGFDIINAKVVARFWCGEIERIFKELISFDSFSGGNEIYKYYTHSLDNDTISGLLYVSYNEQIDDYFNEQLLRLGEKKSVGHTTHISKLEIFEEPKLLCDFKTPNMYKMYKRDLKRAYNEDQKIMDKRYYGLTDEIPNNVQLTEWSEGYYGLSKMKSSYCYVEVDK